MMELISLLVLATIFIIVLIKKYIDERKYNSINSKEDDINRIEKYEDSKECNKTKKNQISSVKKKTKRMQISSINENVNEQEKKYSKIDEFCNKHYKKIWIVFVIILFITVIYKFGEIPTYIGVDEAGMAYDAYCLSEYGTDRYMNSYPLYLTNFGSGQSSLYAYLTVIAIKLFGANMISYRLPMLLGYLLSVIVSYLLISKSKNKKTALLFTFIIITCPFNIFYPRMALDCNLYASFFMLDLYLLDKAKKNYQFFIAGVCIGITLYTYILSWITIPIFLLFWIIYMLYIKKIKIRQILIMGIPIFIFAIPLFYFLLLNYGIVTQTQIGIFTLPILSEFRGEQIHITNIFRTGLESLKVIFLGEGTIYLIYVPLAIIGYVLEFRNAIKEIKEKRYGISTIMIISFTTLLLGLLMTNIATANKANVLYIPILYFVTIAILNICEDSKIILTIFMVLILVLWIDYEYYYYTQKGTIIINNFEDIYLTDITEVIESHEDTKNVEKYVIDLRGGQYIFNLLELKLSPSEFMNEAQYRDYGDGNVKIAKLENYNYIYYMTEMENVDLENEEQIFIVLMSDVYSGIIETLQSNGYSSVQHGYYMILSKNEDTIELFTDY